MVPIIIGGAGLAAVAVAKWIHKSITDADRAEQQRQLAWQAYERRVQLQREAELARERSSALAYVDQNLAQITGHLGFELQKLPYGQSQAYVSRLDARASAAKAQIMWSTNPMDIAYEAVSALGNISREAICENGESIHS
jgi:hypothetical protein